MRKKSLFANQAKLTYFYRIINQILMQEKLDYISKISLENIRCFGELVTLNFLLDEKSDRVAQWNLILGNNGTGKTTVLQIIYLGFLFGQKKEFANPLKDAKTIRKYKEYGGRVIYERGSNWKSRVVINPQNPHWRWANRGFWGIAVHSEKFIDSEIPMIAYGASRKIDTKGLTKETSDISKFGETLFNENATLINAEEWLIQSDYVDKLRESNGNGKASNNKEKVIRILKTLMQDSISDIKIELVDNVPKVLFKSHYGWVGLHQLSLGYKTLIGWMVDFASKLMAFYPESDNPLEERAILLIDEIDLHLHVSFQRKLVKFLTNTFKNTQFIVTAHSPLVVQAAEDADANIILLERKGDTVIARQNIRDVKNWRIDQIYASELFENQNVRSDEVTKLVEKKSAILAKANLTEKDKKDLEKLDRKIGDLPTGKDATEIEAMELIKKAASYLEKNDKD